MSSTCKHDITRYPFDDTCLDCTRLVRDPDEFLNFDDWFLNLLPIDTRPGWRPANDVLRIMEADDDRLWSEPIRLPGIKSPVTLDTVEDLMFDDRDWVGGIVGLHPEYQTVRAGLIALGRAS